MTKQKLVSPPWVSHGLGVLACLRWSPWLRHSGGDFGAWSGRRMRWKSIPTPPYKFSAGGDSSHPTTTSHVPFPAKMAPAAYDPDILRPTTGHDNPKRCYSLVLGVNAPHPHLSHFHEDDIRHNGAADRIRSKLMEFVREYTTHPNCPHAATLFSATVSPKLLDRPGGAPIIYDYTIGLSGLRAFCHAWCIHNDLQSDAADEIKDAMMAHLLDLKNTKQNRIRLTPESRKRRRIDPGSVPQADPTPANQPTAQVSNVEQTALAVAPAFDIAAMTNAFKVVNEHSSKPVSNAQVINTYMAMASVLPPDVRNHVGNMMNTMLQMEHIKAQVDAGEEQYRQRVRQRMLDREEQEEASTRAEDQQIRQKMFECEMSLVDNFQLLQEKFGTCINLLEDAENTIRTNHTMNASDKNALRVVFTQNRHIMDQGRHMINAKQYIVPPFLRPQLDRCLADFAVYQQQHKHPAAIAAIEGAPVASSSSSPPAVIAMRHDINSVRAIEPFADLANSQCRVEDELKASDKSSDELRALSATLPKETDLRTIREFLSSDYVLKGKYDKRNIDESSKKSTDLDPYKRAERILKHWFSNHADHRIRHRIRFPNAWMATNLTREYTSKLGVSKRWYNCLGFYTELRPYILFILARYADGGFEMDHSKFIKEHIVDFELNFAYAS
ncbi:uncharacterized protein BJ171DRAFT_542423, partial [Polychytrium aggregatum]|uniref:uncharacterized protein n=1 Tax=Polychytrium aggregatum TaxID=110093 RepID=UPI0022FDD003